MPVKPKTITKAMQRQMLAMHTSDEWLMLHEMPGKGSGLTGMGLTLLSINKDKWIERRWVKWAGEKGQKRGDGYEYRLTDAGREIRAMLEAGVEVG